MTITTSLVNVTEIIDYVRTQVAAETSNKQHPRDFGNMDNSTPLSDLKKPGIALARYPILYDSRTGEPLLLAAAQQTPLSSEATRDVNTFQDAIKAGRLLPATARQRLYGARQAEGRTNAGTVFLQENHSAHRAGESGATGAAQISDRRSAAANANRNSMPASQYMEAATRLTPESLYLEGP